MRSSLLDAVAAQACDAESAIRLVIPVAVGLANASEPTAVKTRSTGPTDHRRTLDPIHALGDTCPGRALPGVPGVSGFVGDGEGGLGAYDLMTWLGNL